MNALSTKRIKHAGGRLAELTGMYRVFRRNKSLIVAFHRVNDDIPEDGLTCSSSKFEAFCLFFARNFRVVSLSDQVFGFERGLDMKGTLSITFDDGYLDNYHVAAPILQRLGLPATFFVTSGFIGTDHVPEWDRDLAVKPSWMTWDHVRGLASMGFEIGCHTHTHLDMGSADITRIEEELTKSKTILSSEIGRDISLFAFPFGGPQNITEAGIDAARKHFRCCVACHGGDNSGAADPYRLNRIGVAEWFSTPQQFGFEVLLGKV